MGRIEQILWDKTTDELSQLCKIANIKGRSGYKDHKVKILIEFYSNENWVEEVFEKLSKYEQEMMKCFIQNKYHPEQYEIEAILEKYKSKKHYYSDSYFERDSKVNLFYIDRGYIPKEFKEKLDKLVEPLKVEIKPTKEKIEPEDFYANVVERDARTFDFDEFIKFINTNKIKATKTKGQMPKSSLVKLHNKLRYRDVLKNDEIDFNNIRSIEDTTISNGIMNLLRNSLIIRIKKGEFFIDELFCEEYQQLNKVDKIKFLLKHYTRENSVNINECERIESGNFRIQNKVPEFGPARKMIIEYLKKCPIDEWINMEELKKWIRINEYYFLRSYTGQVMIKDQYYNSYYNTASHDELEKHFIDIVFMEYLATMGIVDVVMFQNQDDYGYKEFLEVDYFKITKFGSYVLDMVDEEETETKDIDSGFMITEDFEIRISDNNQKLKYELYFDRFLNKKSENPLIYNLNFKGMVKALELGIKFKEIYEYLQINSQNDIPSNVKAQFEDWIKNSKKIKIKNVTILEVNREDFKDIVENEDFRDCIDSVRSNVIVIKSNKIEEIKKVLNKNGKFCV